MSDRTDTQQPAAAARIPQPEPPPRAKPPPQSAVAETPVAESAVEQAAEPLRPTPGLEVGADEYDRLILGQRERKLAATAAGASQDDLLERDLEQSAVIDPDPDLHYKWVNRVGKDGVRVLEHQGRGFVIVRPGSLVTKARPACGIKRTDPNFGICYILGDLILMAESRDNHNRRYRRSIARMEFMSSSGRDEARETINKIARDEIGKSYSHKDATFDTSHEDPEVIGERPLPKPDYTKPAPAPAAARQP